MSESKRSDLWRLHVPVVVGVLLCAAATYVEFQRAQSGVSRAWVYTLQWPLIGGFLVWMWYRLRKEGNMSGMARAVTDRWAAGVAAAEESQPDPELEAWQEHVARLERDQPPGGPQG